jgi:hypothetical protein
MITVLELMAGLVVAGASVTVLMILAAFELGRLASRDNEQREVAAIEQRDVAAIAGDRPRFRAAA